MGLKTPVINGARQELPCLESPEVNGARQAISAVNKYVDGAWQKIWPLKNAMVFSSVISTGSVLPEYEYIPSANGSSAYYKVINKSANSTSSLGLILDIPLNAGESHTIEFTLSGKTTTATAKNDGIAVYGRTENDTDILLENFVSPTNGEKSIVFTPQNNVEHIILNLEVYGAVGVYHEGTLSDLVIDGTSYRFE